MSDRLRAFLASDDLDELLAASRGLEDLSEEDQEIIRAVLRKWDNPQAVSNLLFYPELIPKDIRMDSILKGLAEREHCYYVLAAVVGVQGMGAKLTDDERSVVLHHLIQIMEADEGLLSSRASVSISSFLSVEDAERILKFLSHPNEVTRHNTMAWLLRAYEKKGVEWFTETIDSAGVSQDIRDYALGKLQQHIEEARAGGLSTLKYTLYSPIPSLDEVAGPTERVQAPFLVRTYQRLRRWIRTGYPPLMS